VTAERAHGWELALGWIESNKESVASTGWETLGSVVAVRDDADLDLAAIRRLLQRLEKTIHDQPDRVRYSMNGFVIAAGIYVESMTEAAVKSAEKVGVVSVDVGNTACKVPFAPDSIAKARARGSIGRKRKMARC
jgi:hypothetical protein